jgi:hypothetical protein
VAVDHWDRSRRVLKKNKIFFDTIAAVFLSVMATIVSWGSYTQARLQTRLQTAQSLPFILVKSAQLPDDKGIYAEHRVTIENVGNSVREFRSTVRSTMLIEITSKKDGTKEPELVIPVSGYFAADFETGDAKGLLSTYNGVNNHSRAVALDRYVSTDPLRFIQVRFVHLFTVSYTNALGSHQTECFKIDGVSGGVYLSNDEARKWKDKYDPADGVGAREFSELSGIELEKRIANREAAKILH